MSNPIEIAARALCAELGTDWEQLSRFRTEKSGYTAGQELFLSRVQLVIQTLCDNMTPEMIDAGLEVLGAGGNYSDAVLATLKAASQEPTGDEDNG